MNPDEKSTTMIAGICALAVAASVVFVFWYIFAQLNTRVPAPVAVPHSTGAPVLKKADLGTDLYNKVSNPVGDKIPKTVAPVANPLENVYKNPFR